MRLRPPGTFLNRYEGRFARVASARVWKWTPATVIVFLVIGRAILMLPVHPFLLLAMMVLVPTAIIAACKFLIPVRIAYPLEWFAVGSGFALMGSTLAWWTVAIARTPQQENRVTLCVLIGFWACALMAVGSASVTAIVVGFFDKEPIA